MLTVEEHLLVTCLKFVLTGILTMISDAARTLVQRLGLSTPTLICPVYALLLFRALQVTTSLLFRVSLPVPAPLLHSGRKQHAGAAGDLAGGERVSRPS